MNRVKCFFGIHKWMPLGRRKGKASVSSLLIGDMGKVDITLCVDYCIWCDKEKAYMSTYVGDQPVGLAYAKGILNIVEHY